MIEYQTSTHFWHVCCDFCRAVIATSTGSNAARDAADRAGAEEEYASSSVGRGGTTGRLSHRCQSCKNSEEHARR